MSDSLDPCPTAFAQQTLPWVRMGLIRRLADISQSDFSAHWRGPHGTYASRLPGLRRYHQNHVKRTVDTGGTDRWKLSGLSELWFDTPVAMQNAIGSLEYETVATDTPNVMSMPGVIAGCQYTIGGLPCGDCYQAKVMLIATRRSDLARTKFQDAWQESLVGIAALAGVAAARSTLVTHHEGDPGHVVPYEALPVDAVVELWFEQEDRADEVFTTAGGARALAALQHLSPDLAGYHVESHVIVP